MDNTPKLLPIFNLPYDQVYDKDIKVTDTYIDCDDWETVLGISYDYRTYINDIEDALYSHLGGIRSTIVDNEIISITITNNGQVIVRYYDVDCGGYDVATWHRVYITIKDFLKDFPINDLAL